MGHEIVLADIIASEMSLDPTRVVIYDQRFEAPKDQGIYVVIAYQSSRIVGSTRDYDADTDEEVLSISRYTTWAVNITSRNTDAQERHHEIIMAIDSVYGVRQQEDNTIRIFRTPTFTDLSLIEGSAPLHRYMIPIIISNVEVKRSSILPIEQFRTTQELING